MSNNREEKNNKKRGEKEERRERGGETCCLGRGMNALGNTVDEPTIANNIVAPVLP